MDKKMTPEIETTKTLVRTVKSYVELNKVIWLLSKMNRDIPTHTKEVKTISIIVNALEFLIEKTNEKTK